MTKSKLFYFTISILYLSAFVVFLIIRVSYNPYSSTMQSYRIGDNQTIRVGIMGDTQLIYSDNDPWYNYTDHLETAFNVMKEQQVEVIIFTGDFSNSGRTYAFNIFQKLFEKTYPNEEERPILSAVMGNHDYWYFLYAPCVPAIQQRLWENVLHEKPFSHKVINGYHFINWSSMNPTGVSCNTNLFWAKEQIEKAINADPTKPVFVITHFPPYKTMIGSFDWGIRMMKDLLSFYPQVISFSGHTHSALTDERSIWQGDFTAIQTQAVAYIALELGKENGNVPKDEFGSINYGRRNYMGMIMDVGKDNLQIKRISLEKGTFYKEEQPWIIDIPINKEEFRYTYEKKMMNRTKPYFDSGKEMILEYVKQNKNGKEYKQLRFTQAVNEDFVQSYRIVFKKGKWEKEYLYFSDYFLMPEDRSEELTVLLPKDIKKGKYEVSIYAIESYKLESEVPLKGEINVD